MKNRDKIIGSVFILLIFFIFFVYGIFKNNSKEEKIDDSIFVESSTNNDSKSSNAEGENKNNEIIQSKLIKVQIKGEVKSPGVYTVDMGDRVEDLIKLAGGFTVEADVDKVVSQAKKLRDEECVLVPKKGVNNSLGLGTDTGITISNNISGDTSSKININSATKEELMKVPGIGEVIASNIIEYREKKGGFNSLEDLKNIDRIGDKTFEKFKERLEIN